MDGGNKKMRNCKILMAKTLNFILGRKTFL